MSLTDSDRVEDVAARPSSSSRRAAASSLMLSCTVVICTRNRPILLDGFLEAVSRINYPDFEVLVVDNGSDGEATREVAQRWGARYLREPIGGLSRARNRAGGACRTDLLAYLDDDALPEPHWLTHLIEEFGDPLVMAVAGSCRALRLKTDAEQMAASINHLYAEIQERQVVDQNNRSWFELANFGGLGDGMNMAFRRGAFEVWPGFDERLGRGGPLYAGEEHHAFFALIKLGYRMIYAPRAVVRHPLPSTMGELRKKHLLNLSASAAYVALLFFEESRYRGAVLLFLISRISRRWHLEYDQTVRQRNNIASRWEELLAILRGLMAYLTTQAAGIPALISCITRR